MIAFALVLAQAQQSAPGAVADPGFELLAPRLVEQALPDLGQELAADRPEALLARDRCPEARAQLARHDRVGQAHRAREACELDARTLAAFVLRGLVIASRARDRFGVLLTLGLTSIVFWQAIINVGMTTGLLPVVGIPLPLFSYGGSSALCLLIGVGLVMNVSMRRYFF